MSTRSKKKSENPVAPVMKRVENSWIMFVKESLLDNSTFKIITLPHPAQGKPVKYCLDDNNKKIYEIITFDEPYRSWFIDESIKSDGSIQMVTLINPLFLVLPRLSEQCSTRAIPLEDLLSEKGYKNILEFIPSLDSIADLKGPIEMKAYKYNEEKTLTWLENRVRRLAKVLRQKNIHVTSGATSATFISSNINDDSIDEEFYLKYAFGIICEYLHDKMVELLEKRFDFKPYLIETVGKKRKSEVENNESIKRLKSDSLDVDMKQNGFEVSDKKVDIKKEKTLTAKEKARQKAASGTKTISSFFTKK